MKTRRHGIAGLPSVQLFMFLAIATSVSAAVIGSGPTIPDETAALTTTTATAEVAEGRGHFKNMMMNPYMLIPQLITLGFAPIVLANLKMLVMNALMINNMALNAAIFMTVRNMVFGPRPKVKYVNYGYRNGHHRDDHSQHQYDGDGHEHQHHHRDSQQQQQQQQQQHLSEEEAQMAEYRKSSVVDSSS